MNWYQSAALVDRLASEYALGTLSGGARRRFEAVMRAHPDVAHAAARWDTRLHPLGQRLAAVAPGRAVWNQIEQRAFAGSAAASAAAARPLPWWRRLLAPMPVGALAAGLLLGGPLSNLWAPTPAVDEQTQLPASYVGVLATAAGKPGLIVSSLRQGLVVDLKRIAAVAVPPGQTLFLWTIDAQGAARPVGAIPNTQFTQVRISQPAEQVFSTAVELGVSIEAAGVTPETPAQPWTYRGLCGKLWRVKPPN